MVQCNVIAEIVHSFLTKYLSTTTGKAIRNGVSSSLALSRESDCFKCHALQCIKMALSTINRYRDRSG
jgi:hypothetical protein